jgi:hypothetical protein
MSRTGTETKVVMKIEFLSLNLIATRICKHCNRTFDTGK